MNHEHDLRYPTEDTVNMCAFTIIDFLENYLREHDYNRWKIHEFYTTTNQHNQHRGYYEKKKPSFTIFYNNNSKTIFRDMPNSVFNITMSYAFTYYKQIFFLMAISAFSGMRPSEACNVRQELSPLGKGIYLRRVGNEIVDIELDIREEKQLRSDMVSVGKIKNERMQRVYPRFRKGFLKAYELHKDYLKSCTFEKEFAPMSLNSRGMAMTYDNYTRIFKMMIDELKPIFLKNPDPEISTYGHMLLQHSISPHILRHWFSVRLTLYGEDVAGLQYWRGDKSPQSALLYLKNKGELVKQLQKVNNEMFDSFMNIAEDLFAPKVDGEDDED